MSAEVTKALAEDAREYVPVGLEQRHPWRCTPPQEPLQLPGALIQLIPIRLWLSTLLKPRVLSFIAFCRQSLPLGII